MPTVKLPSAEWQVIEYLLEEARDQGRLLVGPLLDEISTQLDRQEN